MINFNFPIKLEQCEYYIEINRFFGLTNTTTVQSIKNRDN